MKLMRQTYFYQPNKPLSPFQILDLEEAHLYKLRHTHIYPIHHILNQSRCLGPVCAKGQSCLPINITDR